MPHLTAKLLYLNLFGQEKQSKNFHLGQNTQAAGCHLLGKDCVMTKTGSSTFAFILYKFYPVDAADYMV